MWKTRITSVAITAVAVLLVATFALAQPGIGISKRPPLSGAGTTSSPFQIDGCGSGSGSALIWGGVQWGCGATGASYPGFACSPGLVAQAADGSGSATCVSAGGSDKLGPDGNVGDATVGGTGTTLTVNNAAITLSKLADLATSRILCRFTAGTGVPEACTPTQITSLLDAATTTLKGLVPAPGSATGRVLTDALTWVGIVGVVDGDKGDVVVSSSGTLWLIDTAAITLAKMASLAQGTVIGRALGAGTGVPTALSQTQLTALVNPVTATLNGSCPAPGTSSGVKYLRDDFTWVTPPDTNTTYTATSPLALVGTAFGLANGDRGDISLTTGTQVGDTWTIDPGAVALSKIANITGPTVLGRTSSTGAPTTVSPTALTALLDLATTSVKGLMPVLDNNVAHCLDGTGGWSSCGGGAVPETTTTTGVINDYPLGSTTTTLFVAGSGATQFNGFVGGTDGRCADVMNSLAGSSATTLVNEQSGSTAVNRINTWAGVTSTVGQSSGVRICYESADARWRPQDDGLFGSITDSGTLTVTGTSTFNGSVTINAGLTSSANVTLGNTTANTLNIKAGTTTINSVGTNQSVFSTTDTTVIAGGATGVLNLGTSATGGVNIGSATNDTFMFATSVTARSGVNGLSSTNATTAQTAGNAAVRGDQTGSYNTTAGALVDYGVRGSSTATRSTGANTLANYGVYGSASGAQVNYGVYANDDLGTGANVVDVGTLPTLSSCGTSSRTGGAWSWTITPGTVASCAIAFGKACASGNAPTCLATHNYNSTAVNYFTSKSASGVTLNVTGTGWNGSQSEDVACICH